MIFFKIERKTNIARNFLLLFFTTIFLFSFFQKIQKKEINFRQRAKQLSFQKAEQICKKYNMRLCGHGEAMMYEIEEISLHFIQFYELNKEEARRKIILIANELIDSFNKKNDIIQFYKNYPLTSENFDISIVAADKNCKIFCYPNIDMVSLSQGKISYTSMDPTNKNQVYRRDRETYEEACEILRKEREDVSKIVAQEAVR